MSRACKRRFFVIGTSEKEVQEIELKSVSPLGENLHSGISSLPQPANVYRETGKCFLPLIIINVFTARENDLLRHLSVLLGALVEQFVNNVRK